MSGLKIDQENGTSTEQIISRYEALILKRNKDLIDFIASIGESTIDQTKSIEVLKEELKNCLLFFDKSLQQRNQKLMDYIGSTGEASILQLDEILQTKELVKDKFSNLSKIIEEKNIEFIDVIKGIQFELKESNTQSNTKLLERIDDVIDQIKKDQGEVLKQLQIYHTREQSQLKQSMTEMVNIINGQKSDFGKLETIINEKTKKIEKTMDLQMSSLVKLHTKIEELMQHSTGIASTLNITFMKHFKKTQVTITVFSLLIMAILVAEWVYKR